MKRLFDISAVVLIAGWFAFVLGGDFLRDRGFQKKYTSTKTVSDFHEFRIPKSVKSKAHWRLPEASEDAVGSDKKDVTLSQGKTQLPNNRCLSEKYFRGAKLYALGTYSGGNPSIFERKEKEPKKHLWTTEAHRRVNTTNVTGNATGPEVTLILTSYESVVWNFEQAPVNRIRAVIAHGYYPQLVANLPLDIPVRFVSNDKAVESCGRAPSAHQGGKGLDKFAKNFERIAQVGITAFNGSYEADFLSFDGGFNKNGDSKPQNEWSVRANVPITMQSLLPGFDGLAQLIEAGAIRPATEQDKLNWHKKAAQISGFTLEEHKAHPALFMGDEAFVITREIEMPVRDNLLKFTDFILEDGVPRPRIPAPFRATFYFMETGTVDVYSR